ncbi:MAG: MerR family transcriptional regulator, partial [Rubrivivax sp.]
MNALSIGTVAKQAGCSVPTIRYYEDIGLLPPAARTAAGQRSYGKADLQRLGFIRRCRELGFPVDQV